MYSCEKTSIVEFGDSQLLDYETTARFNEERESNDDANGATSLPADNSDQFP